MNFVSDCVFQFESIIFVGSVIQICLDQNDRAIPLALYILFQCSP